MRLTEAQERFIDELAPQPDGRGKHAAFMRGVLGETYFDIVFMSAAIAGRPLSAESMRYIAEHWDDENAAVAIGRGMSA